MTTPLGALRLWLERTWQDLKQTARVIVRAPGFAAIAVVSIAFGTGANIAIFSTADALLLRPLPVPRWTELVTVGTQIRREVSVFNVSSYPDYVDVRARARSFTGLAAFDLMFLGISPSVTAPPQVRLATVVTSNYFDVLGVPLAMGRTFHADEDQEGRAPTVIIGHQLWQSTFSGDPAVLGRTLRVAGIDCTIVGVASESFWGLNQRYMPEAAFLPIGLLPRLMPTRVQNPLTDRDLDTFTVKGRLRDDVSMADARAELDVIATDLGRLYPATNAHQELVAQTELEVKAAGDPFSTGALLLLSILSIAVLAVGCTNVAGLLASRAPLRSREIALRLAIGASRARLFRQLMTESGVLALVGGVGGLGVGYAGVALLNQIRYPSDVVAMPRALIDDRALTVALVLAAASAILFGLVPAWQATRTDLIRPLKSGDAAPAGRLRLTGRNLLVSVQVTLSLVLVTIAVFTSQAFSRIFGDGPGFRVERMAKITIDPTQTGRGHVDAMRVVQRVLDEARALPGVESVGAASAMPLFSFEVMTIAPEGERLLDGQVRVPLIANRIDERYLDTMGIALLAGRGILATDLATTGRVAVVNETAATHYWPGESAVGKRFRLPNQDGWIEVVGVARTTKYWFPGENPQRAIYLPFRQHPTGPMVVLAATTAASASVIGPLRDLVHSVDPDVPAFDAATIEDYYDARATSFGDVLLSLVTGMGVMGMTLTLTGLYGLVSFAASRRTREIGIRIAIGASPGRVLRMILRQGLTPAWLGIIAGVALSIATAELLRGNVPLAYDYRPQSLLVIVPLLVGVSALAALVPARRAASVPPTVALRCE